MCCHSLLAAPAPSAAADISMSQGHAVSIFVANLSRITRLNTASWTNDSWYIWKVLQVSAQAFRLQHVVHVDHFNTHQLCTR